MSDGQQALVDAARLRPRFELELPAPADQAMDRIRESLDSPALHDSTMSVGRHAEFLVDAAEQKIWSPRLTIRVDDAPGGSTLRGRFSPRPDVWTGFMFVYFLMAFVVVFGATLGYVQQLSGQSPWGYWGIPLGLLVIAGIHLAGYVGQRLGAAQMRELRATLDAVLAAQFDETSDSDPDGPDRR